MEQKEERRIRGRADYWKKFGNAKQIIHKPCPHCGKVIMNKNRFALKLHIRRRHKHKGYFSCGICGKPFDADIVRAKHERTHLSAAERTELSEKDALSTPKWLCPTCGKEFSHQSKF